MPYSLSYIQKSPIVEIDHFLTPSECDELLTSRIHKFQKAKSHYPAYYRNNDRYVEDSPTLAQQLFLKLKGVGIQSKNKFSDMVSLNECIRFCRYQKGQSFSTHQDGVYYPNTSQASKYTFLIYLNDTFDGGVTEFYNKKSDLIPTQTVIPKKGKLLVFAHNIWHKGSTVIQGSKYILRSDIIVNTSLNITHHQGYIWNLLPIDNKLFMSCGRDGYIKVWNTHLELQHAFKLHSKSVIKMIRMDETHFLSCSRDFRLIKWTLDGHVVDAVRFREMIISLHTNDDGSIIAGGTSGTLYHLSNRLTVINRIAVHTDWIWDVMVLSDRRIISCSENGTVQITNLSSKTSLCLYKHTSPLFCMYLRENMLYVGTQDGKIVQLNIVSKMATVLNIHQDAVRAIKVYNETLITCGEDNCVVTTPLTSMKPTTRLKASNFIQDMLPIENTMYAAGYNGIIYTIKL
ncbi:2OG-Fe(II) oxygenase [uncultured Dokdonia sp.]|uniref:2OG-Fe(II) oxygenase n=1 Tax=uncultured Dokdonia sp. TaxID=575653 RepID=UPI002618EFC4|nr:2OG-Fe(II) oxygenase [uncultured Dokdonia sp.]